MFSRNQLLLFIALSYFFYVLINLLSGYYHLSSVRGSICFLLGPFFSELVIKGYIYLDILLSHNPHILRGNGSASSTFNELLLFCVIFLGPMAYSKVCCLFPNVWDFFFSHFFPRILLFFLREHALVILIFFLIITEFVWGSNTDNPFLPSKLSV